MIYKKSIRKYGDDLKRQIIYILHDLFFLKYDGFTVL